MGCTFQQAFAYSVTPSEGGTEREELDKGHRAGNKARLEVEQTVHLHCFSPFSFQEGFVLLCLA